jgi:hypothetical protein
MDMLAITLLLMAAAPAPHPIHARHHARIVRTAHKARRPIAMTSPKLLVVDCAGGSACAGPPAPSPYRLPLPEAPEPSGKDMALAVDGSRCAVIGQTICPRRTHKIVQIGDPAPGIPVDRLVR